MRIESVGAALRSSISDVLDAVPDRPQGPVALAKRFNIDKVLASRVLKAMRSPDAMSVMHRAPGPEPLRRLLRAAGRHGVERPTIEIAEEAVRRFESLIRDELGDRGALDAIVAAWVPEARREFEVRRKQAAFKAMSQLKGAQAEAILATAIIHPSDDGKNLDLVWLTGLFGLHRLTPNAGIKVATRRMGPKPADREPRTLTGEPLGDYSDAILAPFSSDPPPSFDVHRVGEVVHYTLAEPGFGPASAVDVVLGEANFGEMRRYIGAGEDRKGFVFAEASVPARVLQFDAIVHEDVYPDARPELALYDTAFEGVANVNDRSRDIDRFDMLETIEPLGRGVERLGSSAVPRYGELIRFACDAMGWNRAAFRTHRALIDHPVYGSQIAMCFDPPRRD
ncbi:MAG: hypothetical protein CMJ31_07395 [Phycisphaerae bacterium]|nr:hypothetical protein [Phycisphaerae bacterium]